MGKRILTLAACLIISVLIVIGVPILMNEFDGAAVDRGVTQTTGLFEQQVVYVNPKEKTISRLYADGKLIGIVRDVNALKAHMKELYDSTYEKDYPDSSLGLGRNVYIMEELSCFEYEDRDDEIIAWLDERNAYSLEAVEITFSDGENITGHMYVLDKDLYLDALNEYLSLFISKDAMAEISRGNVLSSTTTFGTKETGVSIAQTISTNDCFAPIEEICTTKEQILEYLKYGSDTEKEYYTVEKYDTVAGVGSKNHGLSATQVMMINSDQITSVDQVLPEGMKLCVTYFESPIDVTVYRQTLRSETVFFQTTYTTDETMLEGESEVRQSGSNGQRNALYSEKWINGVLVSGKLESYNQTKAPVNEVVVQGTKQQPGVGTGNYVYPVANPGISCVWGCYYGHKANDFVDEYNRWGDVYATDNGVVITNTYDSISGWYVKIDHQNGYVSYYGHMIQQSDLPVGSVVEKGQVIGHIGMTGLATGPHVHFYVAYQGKELDVCNELNGFPSCEGLVRG